MEVIARKKRNIFGIYVGVMVLGVILFIGTVILALSLPLDGKGAILYILLGLLSVVTFGVGLWMVVQLKKTPDVLIIYENGKLKFADGLECAPRDLSNVTYKQATSGRYGIQYAWGTLMVTVNGAKHSYSYTADVIAVHDRLIQLMLQARENNNG